MGDPVRYLQIGPHGMACRPKTVFAHDSGQFAVPLLMPEIALIKLLFPRQGGRIDQRNQRMQIHDGGGQRRGGKQKFEGCIGQSRGDGGGFLVILPQPVRLFENRQIPMDCGQLRRMGGGPFVSCQHHAIRQSVPGNGKREREVFLHDFLPLTQKRERNHDQDAVPFLEPLLRNKHKRLESLAKRPLVAENCTLQILGLQREIGGRHLKRKDLHRRRRENRKKPFGVF